MRQNFLKSVRMLAIAGVAGILVAGCASTNPQPFEQYDAAIKEAGDNLDQVLAQDIGWSRDNYVNGVLSGTINLQHTAFLDHPRPLTVTFPVSGGAANKPTFYELQDVRVTLSNLNRATEKYVGLLVQLAGNGVINTNAFDTMAENVDASMNSLSKNLGAQVPGPAIPAFSTAGSEVIKLVMEGRRRAALLKVLATNQPAIAGYSSRCLALVHILDQSLANDYDRQATAFMNDFQDVPRQNRTTDPKARASVDQLLQLNTTYLALVASLKSTESVYQNLPKGHEELLQSIKRQPRGFDAINDLYQEGKRLKTIYDSLQQSNAATTTNE